MSEAAVDNGQGSTDPVIDNTAGAAAPADPETQQPAAAAEPPAEVPDIEYTDFNMPEGVSLDSELLDEFKPYAKELGLDQEKAQRFVDMAARLAGKVQQSSIESWQNQVKQWGDAARADAEMGGQNFDANLGIARAAIDKLGSPELVSFLDESGLGNHPEVVRFAYKVGKLIGSDSNVVRGNASATDPLAALYPTMQKS